MIDRSPLPEKIPPGKLLLRTAGACDFDPQHLLEVFGEQRRRFVAVLQGFGPDDWAAPTRCADWSAHDVVRHLCDGNAIAARAGPDDHTLDIAAGFDPRITPRGWLTASAGESPDATLTRFVATSGEVIALLRTRLAQKRRFDIRLPYGPMDWTVLVLHGFWDSWLHERDVLLARGTDHPTDDDATAYATAYGLFIAVAVASMFGHQVQEKLTLGGDGGGAWIGHPAMNPTWRLADPTHAALRVAAQITQIGIAGDDAARSTLATHIGGSACVLPRAPPSLSVM